MEHGCRRGDELGFVTQTLRSHAVPFDDGLLKTIFQDPEHGPALAEWVRTYLTSDTLLSADELSLYAALEKGGKVEKLQASPEFASLLPLGDQELKMAIDELNRSTDVITKQTETLRQQQDALNRLLPRNGKHGTARAQMELTQTKRWAANKKALDIAVEETSQSIEVHILELEEQSKNAGDGLLQTINEILQSDDKLLSSLQKLGWELETNSPKDQVEVDRMRDMGARLIKYTVETIRTRLDRLYLEALLSSPQSGMRDKVAAKEATTLQEELESLYAEILPVAQMSIEQQYLEPALKSIGSSKRQNLKRAAVALDYISACVDYLLDHMERISERVEILREHREASNTLINTAREELSVQIKPTKQQKRRSTIGLSPVRRPRAGTSPARNRAAAGRRRSSGGPLDDPPLDQLLRTLALGLPHRGEDAAPSSSSSDHLGLTAAEARAQLAALTAARADRTSKADDVARNVQEAFETAAVSHLKDARGALGLIRDSVLAESPFGDVRLADPELLEPIEWLAGEVGRVAGRLEGAERAARRAAGQSVKRNELVARWGR